LREWIDENKKPIWEELNFANIYSVWGGVPNFIAFVNNVESEDTKRAQSVFTSLAKEYAKTEKLNFVVVNGDSFKDFVESLGLSRSDLPTFTIINSGKQEEFFFPKEQTLNVANAKRWIDLYLNNKLEPVGKELYTEEDDVYIINKDNWDEVVLSPEQDVLVEFYSDQCQYCKVMAPHYKLLAQLFSQTDGVVISAFDTSKSNPRPELNVTGIPSLLFFKSTDKTPIPFDQPDRGIDSLMTFIFDQQTKLSDEDMDKIKNVLNMANKMATEQQKEKDE